MNELRPAALRQSITDRAPASCGRRRDRARDAAALIMSRSKASSPSMSMRRRGATALSEAPRRSCHTRLGVAGFLGAGDMPEGCVRATNAVGDLRSIMLRALRKAKATRARSAGRCRRLRGQAVLDARTHGARACVAAALPARSAVGGADLTAGDIDLDRETPPGLSGRAVEIHRGPIAFRLLEYLMESRVA